MYFDALFSCKATFEASRLTRYYSPPLCSIFLRYFRSLLLPCLAHTCAYSKGHTYAHLHLRAPSNMLQVEAERPFVEDMARRTTIPPPSPWGNDLVGPQLGDRPLPVWRTGLPTFLLIKMPNLGSRKMPNTEVRKKKRQTLTKTQLFENANYFVNSFLENCMSTMPLPDNSKFVKSEIEAPGWQPC